MSPYDDALAALNKRIEAIKKEYEPRIQALKEKGKQLEDDYDEPSAVGATVGVDFKIDWKDVELIFDVPKVSLVDKKIVIDLPELRSNSERIVFDVPDVRMVNRKVGQYPEFHGLTVVWKDIVISVPEPYMRRVEIVFDVPSVTMRQQTIVLGIPKIDMDRVRWVVGLPQFTVISVSAQTQEIKKKGDALAAEGQQLGSEMKAKIEAEVANFRATVLSGTQVTKSAVANQFDAALGSVKSAIDRLQAQGVDPIKVPATTGNVNLRKTYTDLATKRSEALGDLDKISS
jgi:hypothetical protein